MGAAFGADLHQDGSPPAAITGIRTYMAVSRYMLLAVGEPQFQGGFFNE